MPARSLGGMIPEENKDSELGEPKGDVSPGGRTSNRSEQPHETGGSTPCERDDSKISASRNRQDQMISLLLKQQTEVLRQLHDYKKVGTRSLARDFSEASVLTQLHN